MWALTFPPSVPQALHLGELAQQAAVISLGDTKGGESPTAPTGALAAEMGTPRRDWEQGQDPVLEWLLAS